MPEYTPENIKNSDGTTKAVAMYNLSGNATYAPEQNKNPDGTYKAIPVIIVNGNGGAYIATTSTAAATAVKVVDGLPADYTPIKGDFLTLKFLVASSVASPKVKINNVEYFLTWKLANLTASANYTIAINQTILTQFNGTSFEFLHLPDWSDDNTDTYDRVRFGGNATVAGMAILTYQICGIADDGKAYPLYNNTAKTVSDKIFRLDNNYFVQTVALAAAAYFTTGAYYQLYQSNATNVPAMVGTLATTDYGKDLYLVGTISGTGFKLDNTSETSWRTTTLPTSENGKIYIKLGVVGSSITMFTITLGHTPMEFKGGAFKPYGAGAEIKDAVAKTTLVDADTIAITDSAASNITKKITWANVKVVLKTYFDTLYTKVVATLVTPKVAGTAAIGTDTGFARGDHVHPAQTSVSGNAGTATKLATARTINGVSFDGSANITIDAGSTQRATVYYGTTSTVATTATKIVDGLTGYVPAVGDIFNLKFLVASSVAAPTLSINGTVYQWKWKNGALSSVAYALGINQVVTLVFDGTNFEFTCLPDWSDNDTLTNTNIGGNTLLVGEIITQYKLIAKGIDGKLHPLCIGDVTTATKTVSTQIFDLSTPIFWKVATGSTAVDGKLAAAMYYEYYYSNANVQYAFNGFASTDFNKQLYLVGTITGGGFKLDNTSLTSWYTTTIPTTADGKVYKPIGYIGDSATIFNLTNLGQLMEFKNGVFQVYAPSPFKSSYNATTQTVYIRVDGGEV